jgi:WD40 repeat protein
VSCNNHRLHQVLVGVLIGLASSAGYADEAGDAARRGLGRLPETATSSTPAGPTDTPAETPVPRPETGMHTADINQAAVTADGRLLTVSDDKTARLWHLDAGTASRSDTRGLGRLTAPASQVLRVPIGPRNEGKLYAVAVSPVKNRAVVAGSTGLGANGAASVYYVIDLASGNILAGIPAVPGSVRVMAYSRDGRYLAVGSGQGWLRIVDLENKDKPTAMFDTADSACKDEVTAARFLNDGRLVTACLDGQLRLYDAAFHLLKDYRFPPKHRPWRLAVSPQEDKLAVGSQDEAAVALFSLADLQPVGQLKGDSKQRGTLSVVAWIGDSIFGAGTYGDKQGVKYLRVWNTATKQAREWPLAENTVNDLTPLPDGRLAYVTAEPSIGFVDPATSQATLKYKRSIADFRDAFEGAFAVSDDGTVVDFGLSQKGRSPVRFDFARRTLTRDPPARTDLHRPILPPALKNWRNSPNPTLASKPLALSQNERSLSAASAPDGSALIGGDYSLQLWRAGRQLWNIDVPGPAWAVNLTPNGPFVLAALGDGTIRWYDAANGRELLALFATADGRWLVWNPDGYFDHSEGAADLIGYHVNQGKAATPRFVLSGQMHERFYRPDILGAAILGTDSVPPSVQPGNVQTIVTQRRAPEVKLLSWCVRGQCTDVGSPEGRPAALTVDAPEVMLRFALEDKGSGIGDLVVRRNLATVSTRGLGRAKPAKSGAGSSPRPNIVERTVALEPGDNLITVTAFDAGQTIDAGESVRLPIRYETASTETPALHILSIGIDQYASPAINKLKNAVSDAKGIAERLAANPQSMFSSANPIVLVNEQADLAHIKQALNQVVTQAKPNDVVVLFLAGHGTKNNDGSYSFLPYDVDVSSEERLKATALTQDGLTDSISALPATRMAVLIDSCYSGAFAVQDSVLQDRKWTGALVQETGRFVLAGASGEQEALDGINGHGVFTAVVLDGLNGKADQEVRGNRDQYIDIFEILEYARKRVPEEARKMSHNQNATPFFLGSDTFNLSISGK